MDIQKSDYEKFLEKEDAGEFIPESELEEYLNLLNEMQNRDNGTVG